MATITFSFKQAFDIKATNAGFTCRIESNHGNVVRFRYTLTAQDIADIQAGTINRRQLIVREIKNAWQIFKARLDALNLPEKNYTDDGSGNLSYVTPPAPAPVALPKDTVTQTDLDAGTILNPPP